MKPVLLGYFSRTHGLKGELLLREDAGSLADSAKAIFIESTTGFAPYFIAGMRDTEKGLFVQLEEITTVDDARKLIGKKVFANASDIVEDEEEGNYTGYRLIDPEHGDLGEIVHSEDTGRQIIVTIHYKDREVMLPLADELVDEVDDDARLIRYRVPEGLLEL